MASVTSPRTRVAPVRPLAKTDPVRELAKGLRVEPLFCPENLADPFDSVNWELRSAQIKDESGKLMFEQQDVEIPAGWTQLATNVIVSKYFYGENGTEERERSVKQLIHRVTRTISATTRRGSATWWSVRRHAVRSNWRSIHGSSAASPS